MQDNGLIPIQDRCFLYLRVNSNLLCYQCTYRVNWGYKVTDELEEDMVLDSNESDPFERFSNAFFETYLGYYKKNTTFIE